MFQKHPSLFLTLFLIVFSFSCNKSENKPGYAAVELKKTVATEYRNVAEGGTPCNTIFPTSGNSSQVRGSYGGSTLIVNSPFYQVNCDNGGKITAANGLPAYGNLTLAGGTNGYIISFPSD